MTDARTALEAAITAFRDYGRQMDAHYNKHAEHLTERPNRCPVENAIRAVAALSSPPVLPAEPVAWQWRKRQCFSTVEQVYVWSAWEALQPPYMDARGLAKSDPENYELRPLYAAPVPALDDARDAKRYRWLRDQAHPDDDIGLFVASMETNDWGKWFTKHYTGEALNAAIDAAMQQEPRT